MLKSFLAPFILIMLLSFSCQRGNENDKSDQTLTIDTFSVFPPEFEGCSCIFSNNVSDYKNEKNIFINDFAQQALMKINGVITKFTLLKTNVSINSTTAEYKSEEYHITVETHKKVWKSDETMTHIGKIILTNRNGEKVIKQYYGTCGC